MQLSAIGCQLSVVGNRDSTVFKSLCTNACNHSQELCAQRNLSGMSAKEDRLGIGRELSEILWGANV